MCFKHCSPYLCPGFCEQPTRVILTSQLGPASSPREIRSPAYPFSINPPEHIQRPVVGDSHIKDARLPRLKLLV